MEYESINEENYDKEKMAINIIRANIFGVIILISAIIIFGIPYFLLNYKGISTFSVFPGIENFFIRALIIVLIFIPGIIFHELIHGIFFAMFSKNKFKSVKFGIMPKEKLFSPYCHCKEIIKVNHYKIAAIMPLIILGLIPAGISLIIGNFLLLWFGIIFISAGCGDLLMVMKMIKEKSDALIYDLPDDAGFIVYRPR